MISHTRNLLISSALVLSSFSNMAVGMEGEGEKVPVNLSAWGVASSFVTSFFDPFAQDAQTLKEKGLVQCASDILTADKTNADITVSLDLNTIISVEQVLEEAILTGITVSKDVLEEIIRKGTPVAKAAVYPAIALSCELSGFHPAFGFAATSAALALSNPGRKTLMYATGGLILLYTLSNFPGVDGALLTPEIGQTFQLNKNAVSNSPVVVAGLKDGHFVGVWTDENNPPNLIGRIFFPNGTAVTNEFTVNTKPASAGFDVSALTGGKFIVAWEDQTPAIIARIFNANGGAATNPFKVNQITDQTLGAVPTVAGFTNNDALVSWSRFDNSGNSYVAARVFSSTGGAVTNEFNINQATNQVVGNAALAGLTDGTALAGWYTPSGFLGRVVFPNATFGGSEFKINQTTINGGDIKGSGLTGGGALVTYQSSSGFVGRVIQNGTPSGNEFSIGTGVSGAAVPVAGLTDGNALAVWPNGNVLGKLFDPTGTALTNQFSIPGSSLSSELSVSGLSNGGSVVSWGNATAVYGSEVSFPLPPTPTPTPTPTVAPTPAPKVAPTPTPKSAASGLASPSWFATSVASFVATY
jgi:hypothetical protein